jgi:2-methylisocitrate lyase-like PEP mutase family enzyme
MANMVEQGDTPVLPPERLEALGFKIAAYPLTLLSAAVAAMHDALASLGQGTTPGRLTSFEALREVVGFDAYDAALTELDKKSGA